MVKVNSVLDQRMKKPSNTSKMADMARQSATGNLTSFSGMFSVAELSENEKEVLVEILKNYANEGQEYHSDLNQLIALTSEVKAITNQAALLHGERIKKAHQILIKYKDGAFTAWMVATYGNRQTPYNLMQYYEFCNAIPKSLRQKIDLMPRQAVYALASRDGSLDKKVEVVQNYQGESKREMLVLIRQIFPLDQKDKRRQNGQALIQDLNRICMQLQKSPPSFTSSQKVQLRSLIEQIQQLIG